MKQLFLKNKVELSQIVKILLMENKHLNRNYLKLKILNKNKILYTKSSFSVYYVRNFRIRKKLSFYNRYKKIKKGYEHLFQFSKHIFKKNISVKTGDYFLIM